MSATDPDRVTSIVEEALGTANGDSDTALVKLARLLAAAEQKLASIDSACLLVCRDNTPEALGADVDADAGRYVCLNENGDPLIDTDDPAEVVRELSDLWGSVSERLDKKEVLIAIAERKLQGVLRLEEWVQAGNSIGHPEHTICGLAGGRFGAVVRHGTHEETVATGRTIAEVGRALMGESA